MSINHNVKHITAGAALEAGVLVDSSGALTTGATVTPYGVTTNGASSGSPVAVQVIGLCRAQASAAISQGAALMPAAAGEVATYDGADGSVFIGHAKEEATAQGDLIEIVFVPSLDASDAVTSAAVIAANTGGATRQFSTLTVVDDTGDDDIVVTLAQNVAAADIWVVNLYTDVGTLEATANHAITETGGGTLTLSHATLESHLLTLSAAGAAQLTITDVGGGGTAQLYLELLPREAAAGGIEGTSYFITLPAFTA